MYPVLNKVPGLVFTLGDWLDRLVPRMCGTPGNPLPLLAHAFTDVSSLVPQLVDLAKNGRLPWYPAVDTVAPYFGYLCMPADPATNTAVCIDGGMVRTVGLSTLLWDVFDVATPWIILGFLMVTLVLARVVTRIIKVVTGAGRLEAIISRHRALNAELEEYLTEQATTLVELTVALGPVEGQLLQNDIKVARMRQANVDHSIKLRAAQDELEVAEGQALTLREDLKDMEDRYALDTARARETENRLSDETDQAADVEDHLLHELADVDTQFDALDSEHAALLAAETSLERELAEHTQAHQQAAATQASEVLAAQAVLITLQDEISAEAAAHEAAAIERQKDLAQLVFQVAALTARDILAEREHAAALAATNAEAAHLEVQLTSVNEELDSARIDHASLVGERDRLLHDTSAVTAHISQTIEDSAVTEAALLIATADIHTVGDANNTALEAEVADLTGSLTRTTATYNDVQERLDLSVVEHRQHMKACTSQRSEEADQLAFLETWVAQEEAAVDALDAEAAALTSLAADGLTEFEEERQGLEWRLKMVSGGWAQDQAKLDAARAELKTVRDTQDTERRQHCAAVASYQAGARVDDALADELLPRITEAQARVALLEAEAEEAASLEEVQAALDAVRHDARNVARDIAARDADILSLSAELINARRVLGVQDAETAGLRDRIKLMEAALRLCGFGDGDEG